MNPLWVPPDPDKEFELFVSVTTDPPGNRGIRSATIRASSCSADATVVPGTGGPFAICTGDQIDDGNGNCVCPAGTVAGNNGQCTPIGNTCTGGHVNDGNGNCVCPAGTLENSLGECVALLPFAYMDSDTPTTGELGLLLSGIALAGAAVPALRRREKRGKKD